MHKKWMVEAARDLVAQLGGTFGFPKLGDFAAMAAILVDRLPQLKGPEKEKLVLELFDEIVNSTDTPYLPDVVFDPVFKWAGRQALPGFLTLLCSATKGELDLNASAQ